MAMQAMTESQPATLKLRPVLDLRAAAPLKAEFGALRGRPVSVDATDVDRVGALCLQVLMSAHSTWTSDGVGFSLGKTSPAFEEGLETLGASFLLYSIPREGLR
jgi:chemotaxis protein CheX